MTAAVASHYGTALNAPFIFSYMRRGKAAVNVAKPDSSENGEMQAPVASPVAPGSPPNSAIKDKDKDSGAPNPYETSIRAITMVSTVEGFWETYDFLVRPNDLPTTTDYHFFRHGIKPTWEDPSNEKGGKWIVRLPKGLASRYWEEIILALLGGQFSGVPDGEICGAVVSVRYSEDIIGVWNRTSADREMVDRIRDAIKKVLQLPPHANIEYKPHQAAIQDRSSFRNTQVWKPKAIMEGRVPTSSSMAQSSSIPPMSSSNRTSSMSEHDNRGGGGASDDPRGGGRGGERGGPRGDRDGAERSNGGGGMIGGAGGGSGSEAGERGVGRMQMETRRSNSWVEREERKKRDLNRAWR